MSHIADKVQPFFFFQVPTDDAYFRLDLSKYKYEHLVLQALSGIAEGVSANTAGGSGVPVVGAVDVTDAGVEAVSSSTTARKVGIYNNGANDVIILEGSGVGFSGQGILTDDFGIVLEQGDYWESPVAHKGEIDARTRTGETGRILVTVY